MPKYLIKRRNNWGVWVHLDTWETPPTKYDIESRYGPGEYEILIAQENVIGLRHHETFSLPWNIELMNNSWVAGQPNDQWVADNFGQGYYFIIGNAQYVRPVIIQGSYASSVPEKGEQYAMDLMNQGSAVMRNIYLPFRVRLPWG